MVVEGGGGEGEEGRGEGGGRLCEGCCCRCCKFNFPKTF